MSIKNYYDFLLHTFCLNVELKWGLVLFEVIDVIYVILEGNK